MSNGARTWTAAARAQPRLRVTEETPSALPCRHVSSELEARTDAPALLGSAAAQSSTAARHMRAQRVPPRAHWRSTRNSGAFARTAAPRHGQEERELKGC